MLYQSVIYKDAATVRSLEHITRCPSIEGIWCHRINRPGGNSGL
jgi:hypothetical protein